MFWRVSGLNTASPIDSILDKEDYTLEELLDEDELIQECKSLNARLTTFLKQKETVEKLVAYLVEDAPPDADAKRQYKYPFAACEIFCCEVEGVYNTLLESDDLLDRLFGLLHQPRPLNSMLAGYFARVVGSLLLRRSTDVMQFLQRRHDLLPALVSHVDTTSVAEVLARLVGADDPRSYPSAAALQWLSGTDLLGLLVEALGPEAPAEGQANAAEVLAAVARSTSSPLTRSMASPEFMQRLVDAALALHDGRAATHALNVCIALLEPLPMTDPTMGGGMGSGAGSAADVHEQLRAEAIRCVAAAADRLVSLLGDGSAGERELRTSFGLVRTPVGQLRLKAVDLIAALLRTADPGAEESVMRTGAVQRAMELFLEHPFNNALHGGVAALLTAFEPGTDGLREFLLKDAKLVDWLVAAPETVQPEPNPDAQQPARERRPMRAGYCGHLTQIANRLHHLADSCPLVRDFLEGHEGWRVHVATRLEPRNKLESVFAWQCGRPATHGQDLGGEASLYQGDVQFAALDTAAYSREVYQRYGVYDEDEDDEEEGTPPEWVMELPGQGGNSGGGVGGGGGVGMGKLEVPIEPFAAFGSDVGGGSSESDDSSEEDAVLAAAAAAADSSTAGSGDVGGVGPGAESLDDMQDDAVVLDDIDAAEGLVGLQGGMAGLSVQETAAEDGAAQQGGGEGSGGQQEEAAQENGGAAEEGKEKAGGEEDKEEETTAPGFNPTGMYWKPTFEDVKT